MQCVFTALSCRHVFPCRAVLGRSNSRLFMNPYCLPRALIMSGRFRGVGLMGTRRLGCLAVESVWWVEAHTGSESHSRAVKCLSKASAHSPLSSLVPSLIFLLNCFESLVPHCCEVSLSPSWDLSPSPILLETCFPALQRPLQLIPCPRRAEGVGDGWIPNVGSWS